MVYRVFIRKYHRKESWINVKMVSKFYNHWLEPCNNFLHIFNIWELAKWRFTQQMLSLIRWRLEYIVPGNNKWVSLCVGNYRLALTVYKWLLNSLAVYSIRSFSNLFSEDDHAWSLNRNNVRLWFTWLIR